MFIYIFCHLFIVEWVYVVFRSFVTNLQDTIEVLFSFPTDSPLLLNSPNNPTSSDDVIAFLTQEGNPIFV